MQESATKKVRLDLTKVDGNAFYILGAFSGQARREGWSKDEIEKVIHEAMSGDYNHLLYVIQPHCRCK